MELAKIKLKNMDHSFNVVFMGTPEFAVPSLEALVRHPDINVTGVVTSVDKLGGRGRKQLLISSVKRAALSHGLFVLQPKNLKSPKFLKDLEACRADLIVVVAFRMLPQVVWDMTQFGTINLHASLLPAYRGAAPINWAIMKGETKTGLTTFFIDRNIDTGHIIDQVELDIEPDDTAGSLHDRMMVQGADLVLATVLGIKNGNYSTHVQNDQLVSKAPKIYMEDCEIDFAHSAQEVNDFIRGLSPYPGAWFRLHDQVLKVFSAEIYTPDPRLNPGEILSDGSSVMLIGTNESPIALQTVQLEGRKRMHIETFLNGFRLEENEVDADLLLNDGSPFESRD